jgi:hypothetical protein
MLQVLKVLAIPCKNVGQKGVVAVAEPAYLLKNEYCLLPRLEKAAFEQVCRAALASSGLAQCLALSSTTATVVCSM